MRSHAHVKHNDQGEPSASVDRALEVGEQAAYDELNRFLAGLVRRQHGSEGSMHERATSVSKYGDATANRWNRRWSVKVLGISRLSDVAALCRRLEAIGEVRLVRVNGISADHIHLALVTSPGIDKPAMETLLASPIRSLPDGASFEIEESVRPGSRFAVRR